MSLRVPPTQWAIISICMKVVDSFGDGVLETEIGWPIAGLEINLCAGRHKWRGNKAAIFL